MGDNVLMKISIFFTIIIALNLHAQNMNVEWVDQQIDAILPKRSGIDENSINNIKEPFVFLKDEQNITEPEFQEQELIATEVMLPDGTIQTEVVKLEPPKLTAIINKNALIDKQWYKLDDKVRDMKIIKIGKTEVLLKDRYNKNITLYITQENEKIKLHSNKDEQ